MDFLQLPLEIQYRIYQYIIQKGEVYVGVRNEIIPDDNNPLFTGGLLIRPSSNQRTCDQENGKEEVYNKAQEGDTRNCCDPFLFKGGFTMRPCLYQRTFNEQTGTWNSYYNAYLEASHKKCLSDMPNLSLFLVCKDIHYNAQEIFFS